MAKTIQGLYKVELEIAGITTDKHEFLLRILNPYYLDHEDIWLDIETLKELRDEIDLYLELWSE